MPLPSYMRQAKERIEQRRRENPRGPRQQLQVPGTQGDRLEDIRAKAAARLPYKED